MNWFAKYSKIDATPIVASSDDSNTPSLTPQSSQQSLQPSPQQSPPILSPPQQRSPENLQSPLQPQPTLVFKFTQPPVPVNISPQPQPHVVHPQPVVALPPQPVQPLPPPEEEEEILTDLFLPKRQAPQKPAPPPRQTDIFEFFLDNNTSTSPAGSKRAATTQQQATPPTTQPQLQQTPPIPQQKSETSLLTSLLAPLSSKSATNTTTAKPPATQTQQTAAASTTTPTSTPRGRSSSSAGQNPISAVPPTLTTPSLSTSAPSPTAPIQQIATPTQSPLQEHTTSALAMTSATATIAQPATVTPVQVGVACASPVAEASESAPATADGASTEPGTPHAIKSGWLVKQGVVKKNWTSRFFVLTPNALCFYKDERTREGEKKIELEHTYEMLVVDPEEIDKDCCFKLTHPSKRTFYIHSDTKNGMIDWIIAIQEVLDKLKPSENSPLTSTAETGGAKPKLVKEQSVSENHEKYELVYAMLNAIRFSVGKVAALPFLDIGLEELNAYTSFSVNRQGGSAAVPGSNFSYDFTDYAPKVFRKIRECFGFSCADYLVSLTSQYSLSELPTPGKSGSFFYFSSDRKFLLKTISSTEYDTFQRILPNYFLHILQHPNTLLTRLYGVHKISTEKVRNTFFVVMENIFLDYEMDETYDLKGSTVGRKAEPGTEIKKDLDLNRRLLLSAERRNALLLQLEIDCKFLEKNNIMDYSFLLGIRFISSTPEPNARMFSSIFQRERGGYQSTTDTNEFHGIIYYFGIIDIFTTYNIKKQLEHTYKSTVYETKDGISVVDAVTYADRFKKFIAKISGWKHLEISQ